MKPLTADDPRHGRTSAYTNHRCRCDACRTAWRDYCRERNHRLGHCRPRAIWIAEQRARAAATHGTEAAYGRCRCALCRAAATLARATRRLRNPDHERAYQRAYRLRKRRRAIGDSDAALIRRHEALERARATAEGELAALVREQQLDDRYTIGRGDWIVSLDAPDRYGRSRHETIGERDVA